SPGRRTTSAAGPRTEVRGWHGRRRKLVVCSISRFGASPGRGRVRLRSLLHGRKAPFLPLHAISSPKLRNWRANSNSQKKKLGPVDRIVFGTGDRLGFKTITGDAKFPKAAAM